MKKIILGLLFTVSSLSFSQTTSEEYNYLTKGLKIEKESGLDAKKGYTMEQLHVIEDGNYSFIFSSLKREKTKDLAGISVVAKSNVSGKLYFWCIPLKSIELSKRYEADISSLDYPMTNAYNNALSQMFSTSYWLLSEKK